VQVVRNCRCRRSTGYPVTRPTAGDGRVGVYVGVHVCWRFLLKVHATRSSDAYRCMRFLGVGRTTSRIKSEGLPRSIFRTSPSPSDRGLQFIRQTRRKIGEGFSVWTNRDRFDIPRSVCPIADGRLFFGGTSSTLPRTPKTARARSARYQRSLSVGSSSGSAPDHRQGRPRAGCLKCYRLRVEVQNWRIELLVNASDAAERT